MSDKKPITGKLSRTLKTTAMATRTGAKHLSFMGAKRFSSDPEKLQQKHETEIGKILFAGLAQMRGTALKASQLLSMETDLLPEGIRVQLAKSCYQVPPINRALIRKAFIQEFEVDASKLFAEFATEAVAAASLGQVHKAQTQDGRDLAVKIQYPGIRESIDSDLKILKFVLNSLSKFSDYMPQQSVLDLTLEEIKLCLQDEVDYLKEAKNTRWFQENLKVVNIRVPQVYEDFSSERVLSTEFLEGLHVDEWLQTKPSQAERNQAGQSIFNCFLYCCFELNALHADPHAGNYLFLKSGEIGLLDFGCVKKLNPSFVDEVSNLMRSFLENDQATIFERYKSIGLISEELSFETYLEELLPVLAPLQSWMAMPFKAPSFDFSNLPVPPVSHQPKNKRAIKYLHSIQRDQMYFDRTYIGVYQLLKRIGAVVQTENPWVYKEPHRILDAG